MKRVVLLTTIILCLVVFVTTLVAGVILTFTTVGWNELLNTDRLRMQAGQLVDQMQSWSLGMNVGPLNNYTIDETKTDTLADIDTIVITGISEDIKITETGTQFSGRMNGSYRASTKLTWTLFRSGKTLNLKAEYPRWGFRASDLVIEVQIPHSFKGDVQVHSVSGNSTIVNSNGSNWASVDFIGVSGRLTADTAVWPKVAASNVSGRLHVSSIAGKATLKSVSGNIEVAFKSGDPKDLDAETVSGSVILSIPETAKFLINFDTISGSFDSSKLPVQITSQIKRRIDATRNGGGNMLTVKTVSGSLKIEPAP